MTSSYIMVSNGSMDRALRAAARARGDRYTSDGTRAVLTSSDPRAVYLAAGVLPSVHRTDHDAHKRAVAAWIGEATS